VDFAFKPRSAIGEINFHSGLDPGEACSAAITPFARYRLSPPTGVLTSSAGLNCEIPVTTTLPRMSLVDIPCEILHAVLEHLTTCDVVALRLVNTRVKVNPILVDRNDVGFY
jgi:hypothetical protein